MGQSTLGKNLLLLLGSLSVFKVLGVLPYFSTVVPAKAVAFCPAFLCHYNHIF